MAGSENFSNRGEVFRSLGPRGSRVSWGREERAEPSVRGRMQWDGPRKGPDISKRSQNGPLSEEWEGRRTFTGGRTKGLKKENVLKCRKTITLL